MSMSARVEAGLRRGFHWFNRGMLLGWRLGLGRWINCWPEVGGRIMVLVHTGRASGLRRYTPVNYASGGGELFCVAGFGSISDWYRNLRVNPDVEVWLPDGWWAGVAEEVGAGADHLPLLREVLRASGVVAPLMGVDPQRLSDTELAEAAAAYRLVRVRLTTPRTGPGGPGDLSWVWPPAALLGLAWLLVQTRRRHCS